MAEVETEALVRRQARWRIVVLVLLLVLGVLLLALWLARKPIASNVIDRELARRNVPARYEVKRIGFRTQRLERLTIGDPRAPDLTAEWVEVDLRPTLGAPEVRAIRAHGVRLRGRLVNGRLRLGAVDRLLPAPTGAPFRLPDLAVTLSDARLTLATPAGTVGMAVAGSGNLAKGFSGRYAASAPALELGGCDLGGAALQGRVTTSNGRPRFVGPLRASGLACGTVAAAAMNGSIDATLAPGLDGWRGQLALAGANARAAAWTAQGMRAQIEFAGNAVRTAGALRLVALSPEGPMGQASQAELGGQYVVEFGSAERIVDAEVQRTPNIRFEGGFSAESVALANAPRLAGLARSVAGTPLEPMAIALARGAEGLRRSAQVRASLSAAIRGSEGSVRVGSADITGDGVELRFVGRQGVRLVWPGRGGPQIDGRLTLAGLGMPRIVADLRQAAPGSPITGLAVMERYSAGGATVALAPVRFSGGRFSTKLEMSGPLFSGRVEGVSLALNGRVGRSGLLLNPDCAPLRFRSLVVSGLTLEPAALRLCPTRTALVADGRVAGSITAPRLRGTLGQNPITLTANRVSFDGSAFRVANLSARLGRDDRISRLDIASLTGKPSNGLAGSFSDASGQIGKVPLIVSDGSGRWHFARGVLNISGALTVADETRPARFQPLITRDFALRIRGNDVRASGDLLEPATGARVAAVQLRHDLGSGTGNAKLAVTDLRFTPDGLQPEQLTRLTLGVIADVDGSIDGQGHLAWTPEAVTSTGDFRLRAASLAAPFGPATGIVTDVRFTDLLGLETAPGQTLTVATVNPGILAEQGEVSYRVAPGFKLAVESGRWPFAGGELTLRPTLLDFSKDAARELTFDIRGLDAAKFVNKLEFSNINATGTFDGTLPMVFDADGGRIVGGTLTSRPPGGTLSYIGEVSNANLGIWGGIAFDALKSIQYQTMTIALDGRIDGEMLSQIRFAGVSRGSIQPVATGLIARVGGQLARELQRIPFIFNIKIRAPFRGLIAMSRSFSDPSLLIEDRLGADFEAVQPTDSENKP